MKDKMSVDEIKHAMENRHSVHPDQVDAASLRAAGCKDRVFLLPEGFNERASYMADVLVQMLGIGSPITGDLRFASGVICQSLSYLVNSASWRDGELHDFDRNNISRKLSPLVSRKESV